MTDHLKTIRELIAEGHEQFWFQPNGWDEFTLATKEGSFVRYHDGDEYVWMLWIHFKDCPAIPILKPCSRGSESERNKNAKT